jgi:hypothetical protein
MTCLQMALRMQPVTKHLYRRGMYTNAVYGYILDGYTPDSPFRDTLSD